MLLNSIQPETRKNQFQKTTALTLIDESVTKPLQTSTYVTENFKNKPWLNEDGTLKSDKEISRLGKSWNIQIWEEYLNFSTGVLDEQELVFFPYMNSQTMNNGNDLLEELREIQHYPVTQLALELAIDELKPLEQKIIKKLFWENVSSRELADEFKTTLGNIRVIKSRALNKLKKILPSKKLKKKLETHKSNQNKGLH